MFTENYINWQRLCFYGQGSASFKTQDGSSLTGSVFVSGQNSPYGMGLGVNMNNPRCDATGYNGLCFGSGSTPATKADYKLESPITSGLSFTNGSVLVGTETEGKYVATVSHSVKNTSSTPINIYEVGLVGRVYASSSTEGYILLERTVLTEPISIQPGEEKIVTYKITFNQTLNVD